MSEQGPARTLLVGGTVSLPRATPEQIASTRERLWRIQQTAAERNLSPAGVAGLLFLACDIVRCQDDPDLVRDLQRAIGVEVGDHAATVAHALRLVDLVMAERPQPQTVA